MQSLGSLAHSNANALHHLHPAIAQLGYYGTTKSAGYEVQVLCLVYCEESEALGLNFQGYTVAQEEFGWLTSSMSLYSSGLPEMHDRQGAGAGAAFSMKLAVI